MKRILAAILCLFLILAALSGCDSAGKNNKKITVIATIFPEYDWVLQILGDKADQADVTLLLDNGVDLHSYQPTAKDIIKISSCDLFLYVGGESDEWVDDVLKQATNKDMVVINLLDAIKEDLKEEETVEGMQAEEEDEEEESGPEYDEHVWLSLKNTAKLCRFIAEKLGKIDSENKDLYTANADEYIKKINALDEQYAQAVSAGKTKTLLFGDRFPFRYLAEDYGLNYYAAFKGCSAESEASFETVKFLAGKVDELNLKAILQIEGADGKLANKIKDTTKTKDQAILTLDSLQSTTSSDVEKGATYLAAMEKNLAVLKEALK